MEEYYRFRKKDGRTSQKLFWLILAVLLLGLMVFAGFYLTGQNGMTDNYSNATETEERIILSRLSLIALLPEEEASIETVNEDNLAKARQLTGLAEAGDKLVSFPESNTLIVYRPTVNKVLWMGLLNVSDPVTPEISQ